MSGSKVIVVLGIWLGLVAAGSAQAQSPIDLLTELDAYAHAVRVNEDERTVVDHEIGLGAMQKVRGSWRFKHSERQSGLLTRYTWQIVDGFTSAEVLAGVEQKLQGATLLFACDGRSCGQGAQWANRVFGERVLYGRDDLQRYRAYDPLGDGAYRLLLFSSARTADRQYLHAEVLSLTP